MGLQCLCVCSQVEDLPGKPKSPSSRPQLLLPEALIEKNRESPNPTIWDGGFCWIPPCLSFLTQIACGTKGTGDLDYLYSQHEASCGLFKFFFIRPGNSMANTQTVRKPPAQWLPAPAMAVWFPHSLCSAPNPLTLSASISAPDVTPGLCDSHCTLRFPSSPPNHQLAFSFCSFHWLHLCVSQTCGHGPCLSDSEGQLDPKP